MGSEVGLDWGASHEEEQFRHEAGGYVDPGE